MKILFLCTAHNSLSQRLYLILSPEHEITIEYALSADIIIEAARLAKPHLIICPFLTTLVPKEVYTQYMTLIIHPGPPGDAGPSALDWVLMGDDGANVNADDVLKGETWSAKGRSHWGVTVLQAIEEFDAGPVWAFEQFPIDINDQQITKSSLYRGDVTRAATTACVAAIERIKHAADQEAPVSADQNARWDLIQPLLRANRKFRAASVTTQMPFLGGPTYHRPLLKATERGFDVKHHSSEIISRRVRASDSQPGCLSSLFGPSLYIYGGIVEEGEHLAAVTAEAGAIISTRHGALCVKTVDGRGIWITHARRIKKKTDPFLWPKVPAVSLLLELGVLNAKSLPDYLPSLPTDFSKTTYSTFQEVFVEYDTLPKGQRIAYLTFDFYNGAMSTTQCHQTSAALRSILTTHTDASPLSAVVLLGGSYFSNGVHLNVIEAAADSAFESWANINAIDDIILPLLLDFADKGIATISALRGNAAAGGVALAAAADLVVAGEGIVLNPAYRALGLFGSEYHSISYYGRTGKDMGRHLLKDMLPISPQDAKKIGLVDVVLPGFGETLDLAIHEHISSIISSGEKVGQWKNSLDLSAPALARARMQELGEMSKDFWSARSIRYHSRRRDFVRKVKAEKTPLRFAQHRRKDGELDEEEKDAFDLIGTYEERIVAQIQEQILPHRMEQFKVTALKDSKPTLLDARKDSIFACYYNA